MRRFAFIVMIAGMLVLFSLFLFGSAMKIDSMEKLESIEINKKVNINGLVEEQNSYGLVLDNGFKLICYGCGSFTGKEVNVVGLVERYNGKKRIIVLRIIYL